MGITGIGYEGLAQEILVSRLRLRGVDILVDVRLNAISRKRGFSKKSLAASLEQADMKYVHMPALGNDRDNREGYSELESTSAHEARDRYRDTLTDDDATANLHELAEWAKTQNVAVLCFEEDERHCHREQVIEHVRALLEREMAHA